MWAGHPILVAGRGRARTGSRLGTLAAGYRTRGVSAMGNTLLNKTVVVVGRGSGIARAITLLAQSEGARVIVAGRDQAKLAGAYRDSGVTAEVVDITDDDSIAALADRVGAVDHVVSTASAPRRRKKDAPQRPKLLPAVHTQV